MRIYALGLALASACILSGCAASGPAGDPITRKLTWFSYVSGDDLRAQCRPGSPDRYRLIYNADYNTHVRTYDVRAEPAEPNNPGPAGAVIEARAIPVANLSRLDLSNPLEPWQGSVASLRLTPEQFRALRISMAESGVFDPPPIGLRLPSNGYYWLISGCRGGHYFLTAFTHPSKRFQKIRFAGTLLELDPTGVPFPTLPTHPPAWVQPPRDSFVGSWFVLQVGADGLVGPTYLFGRPALAQRAEAPTFR